VFHDRLARRLSGDVWLFVLLGQFVRRAQWTFRRRIISHHGTQPAAQESHRLLW